MGMLKEKQPRSQMDQVMLLLDFFFLLIYNERMTSSAYLISIVHLPINFTIFILECCNENVNGLKIISS